MALGSTKSWLWKVFLGGANCALIAYCALVTGMIIYQHPVRIDLSSDTSNTLSGETRTCLKTIDAPVRVVASYGVSDPAKAEAVSRIFRRAKDVLRRMSIVNRNIKIVDFINMFQRQDAWQRTKKRFGLTGYNRVAFMFRGKLQEVRLEDMAEIKWSRKRNVPAQIEAFWVERSFTAALRRLKGEPAKIYMLQNKGVQGQVGPDIEDTSARGLSVLVSELTANNYTVEPLDILEEGRIPEDCDILMAVGLVGPLMEEQKPIVDFLKSGGKFFFALNPSYSERGLVFLRDWGVVVEPSWCVMEHRVAGSKVQTESVWVTGFNPNHPITRKFDEDRFMAVMSYARPLRSREGAYAKGKPILSVEGENIWGETRADPASRPWENDPQDLDAPFPVAQVASTEVEGGKTCRIAVFGSWSFLSNKHLRSYKHSSLLLNTLWWFQGREELASVRAQEEIVRRIQFRPDGKLRRRLGWALLAILPGCALITGVVAYFVRRK